MNEDKLSSLGDSLLEDLRSYSDIHDKIKAKVVAAAAAYVKEGSLSLKDNGVTGWLGELYTAILFDGKIERESHSYDIIVGDDKRIEVKTRRDNGKGNWPQAGLITERQDSIPTHFVFVKLNNEYALESIYEFNWNENFKARLELKEETIDPNTNRWKRKYQYRWTAADEGKKVFPAEIQTE
jgi:hypothetical protein